jgi:hypothetical protein
VLNVLLNCFRFYFSCLIKDTFLDKFKNFQSDYRLEKRHYCSDCYLNHVSTILYTTPYFLDDYSLTEKCEICCVETSNQLYRLNNVSAMAVCVSECQKAEESVYWFKKKTVILEYDSSY